MASISSISASGPLPNPLPSSVREMPAPDVSAGVKAPAPQAVLASDTAEGLSGQAALGRVATTPIWSTDFELPKQGPLPPSPSSQTPWEWEASPEILRNDAGGRASVPFAPSRAGADAWHAEAEGSEPEEDWNLFDTLTWPIRTITGGVVQGVKAVGEAWQGVGKAVGEGAKTVVGAVGHGIQQVAGQIGNAAAGAWNAITSFRLW